MAGSRWILHGRPCSWRNWVGSAFCNADDGVWKIKINAFKTLPNADENTYYLVVIIFAPLSSTLVVDEHTSDFLLLLSSFVPHDGNSDRTRYLDRVNHWWLIFDCLYFSIVDEHDKSRELFYHVAWYWTAFKRTRLLFDVEEFATRTQSSHEHNNNMFKTSNSR